MENDAKQKLWLMDGNAVVQKAVLDLTPDDQRRIGEAEDTFASVQAMTGPPPTAEEMQTLREAVDAGGMAADDSMSYRFAHLEINRKARERDAAEAAEQRAREADARAAERVQAERKEYLQPANRAEVARQFQQNQPIPGTDTRPPLRDYTDAELDAMSSDDMIRLGLINRPPTRVEDRQGATGIVLRTERTGSRRAPGIKLSGEELGGSGPVLRSEQARRKIKVSAEELASREYRAGIIASDQADRRKVKADISRVLEEQASAKAEKKNAKRI